jgi:hypothetical protein
VQARHRLYPDPQEILIFAMMTSSSHRPTPKRARHAKYKVYTDFEGAP